MAQARGTSRGPGGIAAFDAIRTTNCSGSPKVCTPLRSYTGESPCLGGPVVAGKVLYTTSMSDPRGGLSASDATGASNCSGTPVVCSPLFTDTSGSAVYGDPAVANGLVYFADGDPFGSQHQLFALKLP